MRHGLPRFGFEELFVAEWIYREPATVIGSGDLAWSVIDNEAELAKWSAAAAIADVIRSDLLVDATVRFLGAHGPNGLSAGAIANRTGSVVGVSNVFTLGADAEEAWTGMACALGTLFPSLPLVGYERGQALQAALDAGFVKIGRLRVWLQVHDLV